MDVVVGRVGRAHGIRGEVSVEVRTDEPDKRFTIGAVLRPEPSSRASLTIRSVRRSGERLLLAFEQVPDRTAAETLRGADLHIDLPDDARPDDPEEFYDRQLVGLAVHPVGSEPGQPIGTVAEVLHMPSQDLLAVHTDRGEILVPFVSALVPEIDLDRGRILVADVPGLLDPEES
ncbi:MAG: ribosome maturation factor RimM [Nocardioidaceae bacterium]